MGLFGSLINIAVDLAVLPVAVAGDIVTVGKIGLTKNITKELSEDTEELLTGGDGNLI